jgi:uncharacterized protein YaiL (DUF2058 family)
MSNNKRRRPSEQILMPAIMACLKGSKDGKKCERAKKSAADKKKMQKPRVERKRAMMLHREKERV